MQQAGHQSIAFHEVAGRNHGTIMTRIQWPGDTVAERITEFISRYRVQK